MLFFNSQAMSLDPVETILPLDKHCLTSNCGFRVLWFEDRSDRQSAMPIEVIQRFDVIWAQHPLQTTTWMGRLEHLGIPAPAISAVLKFDGLLADNDLRSSPAVEDVLADMKVDPRQSILEALKAQASEACEAESAGFVSALLLAMNTPNHPAVLVPYTTVTKTKTASLVMMHAPTAIVVDQLERAELSNRSLPGNASTSTRLDFKDVGQMIGRLAETYRRNLLTWISRGHVGIAAGELDRLRALTTQRAGDDGRLYFQHPSSSKSLSESDTLFIFGDSGRRGLPLSALWYHPSNRPEPFLEGDTQNMCWSSLPGPTIEEFDEWLSDLQKHSVNMEDDWKKLKFYVLAAGSPTAQARSTMSRELMDIYGDREIQEDVKYRRMNKVLDRSGFQVRIPTGSNPRSLTIPSSEGLVAMENLLSTIKSGVSRRLIAFAAALHAMVGTQQWNWEASLESAIVLGEALSELGWYVPLDLTGSYVTERKANLGTRRSIRVTQELVHFLRNIDKHIRRMEEHDKHLPELRRRWLLEGSKWLLATLEICPTVNWIEIGFKSTKELSQEGRSSFGFGLGADCKNKHRESNKFAETPTAFTIPAFVPAVVALTARPATQNSIDDALRTILCPLPPTVAQNILGQENGLLLPLRGEGLRVEELLGNKTGKPWKPPTSLERGMLIDYVEKELPELSRSEWPFWLSSQQ